MILEYLSFIYNIFSYSFTIAFYLFIYKYLYDQCIVEKIKETNINTNNKKVIKIIDNKISLSLIYFFFIIFIIFIFRF